MITLVDKIFLLRRSVFLSFFLLSFFLSFKMALQPCAGYGLLVPRGFLITHNDAPQSVGLLWTSDQLVTETSTYNTQNRQTSVPPVIFEPTIAVCERPKTYALNRAASGTGPTP
jgi:hypothetical protein